MNIYARVLVSTVLLITISACSSSTGESDTSLRRVDFNIDFANGNKGAITQKFDVDGRVIQELVYSDGVLSGTSAFQTNELGQLIRASEDSNGDGVFDYYTDYEYVAGDGLTRILRVELDGEISNLTEFEFDNGLAINRKTYLLDNVFTTEGLTGESGTLERTLQYQYDADSRVIGFTIDFDSDGIIDGDMTHSYNADGTLSTIVHTTVSGGTRWSMSATYEEGPCLYPTNSAYDIDCVIVSN